jgi:hypothetical protein
MAQQADSFSGAADFGDGTNIRGVIYQGPPPPHIAVPAGE